MQGEDVFVHKDGSFYNVGFTASPMKNADGITIGTVIEVRNIDEELQAREAINSFNAALKRRVEEVITDRKELEAQLVQAQKMEAIGQLTGGVAHDFNNLLQVIGGNLQLLKRGPLTDDRSIARINNAISGVERGAKLASQLLAFGRQQPLKPKPINAGRIARDMDDMFRRTLGETIDIETIVAAGLWNCLADPRQLENALLNLAINARDAMQGVGKLTVEAGNASLDENYAAAHPDTSEGQYVVIAVTDTGCGITEENLSKVFQPFFTTKAPGEGTGLGLSMVFGFVKQSGGHIAIYSEVGEGTTVRVYLPRTRKAEIANRPEGEWVSEPGNNEIILVVEDDADVRSTTVELLTQLGYKVFEAADADSALAIIQCGISIDLLFTDVVMPGKLRSPELARLAKERIPSLGVLFTSGYTQNSIVHAGKLDDGIELISKPYSSERLSQKVKKVLKKSGRNHDALGKEISDSFDGGNEEEAKNDKVSRVLVLEDEPLIRMTLVETLEALGCQTFQANCLNEARHLVEENEFDIIISDMSLPDGIASEFLLGLVAKRPDIKIVIATGGLLPKELQSQSISILTKPFSDSDVASVLGL
jgi:signal transduction histidine kinase/CheY-like chemotaxis protein